MIAPISGAAGIDFATYMQEVRERHGSRSQPQAAAKATGTNPTENTLSVTDLKQSELETLKPTGALSFCAAFYCRRRALCEADLVEVACAVIRVFESTANQHRPLWTPWLISCGLEGKSIIL